MSQRLKLTRLGRLAYRYTVLTPPSYWQKLLKEISRLADQDIEWEVMLDERIAGMQELRRDYYKIINNVPIEDND